MKKILVCLISLLLSCAIVFILPRYFDSSVNAIGFSNNSSVPQNSLGFSNDNTLKYKIFNNDNLIGIISDYDLFNEKIGALSVDFNDKFSNSKIGLAETIYFTAEYSKVIYEDVDDKIIEYIKNNKLLGVETNCVEFSTPDGTYERIYVISEDIFQEAKNQFILNFISQDTYNRLNDGETIDSPVSFGTVDTGINIKEKMAISKGIAYPDDIFDSVDQIYDFLCYGRNTDRQYYTTKEGDTLSGVGFYFGNMSSKQIMMLNRDIIKDENQIISEGTVLNVTYYSSPLTITVSKERLAQELIFPDPVIYCEDESLPIGMQKVDTKESNGLKNVLYTERWINGVLQEGTVKSFDVIKAATQGKILIGAGTIVESGSAGSGNWRWPVQNPSITCNYTCYAGHGGVDFFNLYDPWNYALAIDSGIVSAVGWTDLGGYYAKIDHQNGYESYYGHFRSPALVEVGQSVQAGEIVGPIGMTGQATGPHVHLAIRLDGHLVDPCGLLDCSLLR